MPTIPHAYTVRDLDRPHRSSCASAEEFEWFVALIRQHGTTRAWGRACREFTYLVVDDHECWTMGARVEETTVLNRQVVG